MDLASSSSLRRRVLQFAYGQAASAALRSLSQCFDIGGLIVPTDGDSPVLVCLEARGLPTYHCPAPSDLPGIIDEVRPDVVVICSYDRILPEQVLPPMPVINVHYAPLPRYRGRATVNWAILNGLDRFCVTIHQVARELDAGAILDQAWCEVGPDDTVAEVYRKLNMLLEQRLGGVVRDFLDGRLVASDQDHSQATYVCTRLPRDGLIDWRESARSIHDQIRALSRPFSGAFSYLDGRKLAIWASTIPNTKTLFEGIVTGRVHKVHASGPVDVLCGDGILRLLEVQVDDGHPVAPNQLIRSTKATLDDGLEDRIAHLEGEMSRLLRNLEHLTRCSRESVKQAGPKRDIP